MHTCVHVVLRQDERAGAPRREGGVRRGGGGGLEDGAARAGGLGLRVGLRTRGRAGGGGTAPPLQGGRRQRLRRDLVLGVLFLLRRRLSPGQLGTRAVRRAALSDPVELQILRESIHGLS